MPIYTGRTTEVPGIQFPEPIIRVIYDTLPNLIAEVRCKHLYLTRCNGQVPMLLTFEPSAYVLIMAQQSDVNHYGCQT